MDTSGQQQVKFSDDVIRRIATSSLPERTWALHEAFKRPETCLDIILAATAERGHTAACAAEALAGVCGAMPCAVDAIERGLINSVSGAKNTDTSASTMGRVLKCVFGKVNGFYPRTFIRTLMTNEYHSGYAYGYKAVGQMLSYCSSSDEDHLISYLVDGTRHKLREIRLAALEGCHAPSRLKWGYGADERRSVLAEAVRNGLSGDRSSWVRKRLKTLVDGKAVSVVEWEP